MSIIKKILILLIILTMCIPLINIIVYAHSVELETEGLISFPMFIMGGSGTVTIKDTIKDYKLYFQAIPVSDEIYLELQKNEPSKNEELKAIKGEYENLKKELDELKDKKDEYETKRIEYNNKISEYNNKVKELQEKQKELTPTYDEKDWKELTDNKFQIDLSQFEGNVAHAIWIKLVTSDNKTYYDEATYELSGTKKTTPNPTPSSEPDKEKLNTKLYVVKDQSETKYLENDQGYITKKIVDSNPDTGEVTIELKIANTNKKIEEIKNNNNSNGKNTEIFFIIDESGSMYDKLQDGKTRRETVREASKTLAKNILDNYNNVKIGIIKFADEAKMTSQLTDNIEELNTAIDTYNGGGTDLYDALVMAKNNYSSSDNNKLAIILTDGSPNSASVHTGDDGKYITVDEITKQELIKLNDSGVNVITMLTELEDQQIAEKIFGTPTNPTVGKYYYISDSQISDVIEKNIYSDLVEKIHVPNEDMNMIKVVDYFPEDITENFDFSYVGEPTKGTKTNAIDKETKTITWDIGVLKDEEQATLKYKLKIKDMQNKNLLEKTISTNEKVVLTYKDKEDKDYTVTLTSSPQIKLSEVKEEVKEDEKGNEGQTNSKDPTVAPNKTLPNTGLSIALIGGILLVIVGGVALLAKYHKLRDVK